MNSRLQKDYQTFLNQTQDRVPTHLYQTIDDLVRRDLLPRHPLVFAKLLAIQAFIGTLTLFFCPQFSLSLTNRHDIFHFFHHNFGEWGCMVACGFLFVGSGALFASILLKKAETHLIVQSKYLYYLAISGIAVLGFLLLGAEVYLDLAMAWMVGGILSGATLVNLGEFARRKLEFSH
jgi:hypothetical protein